MLNSKSQYGVVVTLNLNEQLCFEDSLTIQLTSFSHKRPYSGGPTKASAYLSLSCGNIHKELLFSVHGIDGSSQLGEEHSNVDKYDSIGWMEYEFHLKGFEYDRSIKIIVFRKK